MSSKKSSFHMGNEFNGYGEKVYIKADSGPIHSLVSQENVHLTPDYSNYALQSVGGMPVVLNPESMNDYMKVLMGSMSAFNRVSIVKNEIDGRYATELKVSSSGFIDGAYPSYQAMSSKVFKGEEDYFVVTTTSSLSVRKEPSTEGGDNVIGKVESGQLIKAVTENKRKIVVPDEKDKETRWIKVKYNSKEGWVSEKYVRPDVKTRIDFSPSVYNSVKVTYSDKMKGTKIVIKNSRSDWGILGKGNYPAICPRVNGRWAVAVGPKILIPDYPNDGKLEADDIKPYSKYIKVHVALKREFAKDPKKAKTKTFECQVFDLKAHTYNEYPYRNTVKKRKDKKSGFFISDKISKATAEIENGMVQTGIRYPNADNNLVVGSNNMDGTIIEFCGSEIRGLGFELSDYELDYIETNYEKETRGKMFKKPWE